jgi:hypothetical protein
MAAAAAVCQSVVKAVLLKRAWTLLPLPLHNLQVSLRPHPQLLLLGRLSWSQQQQQQPRLLLPLLEQQLLQF